MARHPARAGTTLYGCGDVNMSRCGLRDARRVRRPGFRVLEIQVTQAANDGGFWADLSRSGRGSSAGSTAEVARQLWNAIGKKAKKTPPAQRSRLTLALDASLSAAQALPPVLSQFRPAYSREAAALGFREMWIVGPTADLCARLDEWRPSSFLERRRAE